MPDPRLATLLPSDRGRIYTHPVTREQHVSSTTVLKTLHKELTRWASRLVAAEAWEQREWMLRVTKEQAVDALQGAAFRDRDQRGDHGSLVHTGCELLAMRAAGWELTPEQMQKLTTMLTGRQGVTVQQALFRFSEWVAAYVDYFLFLEQTVWGNGWAGTFDAIVQLKDGRTCLVDYKTGKGIYRETKLQLASYWSAPEILKADGTGLQMPHIDVCTVVHLPEVGGYGFRDLEVDSEDAEDFERILDHWHWCERTPMNPGVAIPIATAPRVPGVRECGNARRGGTVRCIREQGHYPETDHFGKSKTGSRKYFWREDKDVPGADALPPSADGQVPPEPSAQRPVLNVLEGGSGTDSSDTRPLPPLQGSSVPGMSTEPGATALPIGSDGDPISSPVLNVPGPDEGSPDESAARSLAGASPVPAPSIAASEDPSFYGLPNPDGPRFDTELDPPRHPLDEAEKAQSAMIAELFLKQQGVEQ